MQTKQSQSSRGSIIT